MQADDAAAAPLLSKAELLAVEIDDWAPLGGEVRLELSGRRTVLVGRNGTGKSAVLEGIWLCIGMDHDGWQIRSMSRRRDDFEKVRLAVAPKQARFEIRDSRGELLLCSCTPGATDEWQVVRPSRPDVQIKDEELAELVAFSLTDVMSVRRVPAGVPRQTALRSKQIVTVPQRESLDCKYLNREEPRIGSLAEQMVSRYYRSEDHKEAVAEVAELGQRIGAWAQLEIDAYRRRNDPDALASVLVDGVDLGLLADGTLRVVEILWAIVDHARMGYQTLIIEEPETGVHPGLLSGLLATIDSYSIDRQVIVSTHSPQVVSWAQPQELRVVTREQGKTQIRPLSEAQVAQFLTYLHDQTLGEFVYSGALDGE